MIGCCSRFKECSDLASCVYEGTPLFKEFGGCYYKENLDKGLNFYTPYNENNKKRKEEYENLENSIGKTSNMSEISLKEVISMSKDKSINLLKEELNKEHNKMIPAEPIINYLISECEKDEKFAERISLDNKSIEQCFKYVLQEVKKLLNNKNGWLKDEVVYGIAKDYYVLEKVEFDENKIKNTAKNNKTTGKKGKKNKGKITALDEIKNAKQNKDNVQISLTDIEASSNDGQLSFL